MLAALRRQLVALPLSLRRPSGLVAAFVLLLAGGSAVAQWAAYADAPRDRWCSTGHDRNAHYLYGLAMATELRNGRVGAFLAEFDAGSMVWPPLHGLLLAAVLTVGGPDPRLAVVPSAIGYALSIVFAYRLARRTVPLYGEVAGLAAAGLLIASPAVRAYSTDVMIESLGLAVTLAALSAGLEWLQTPDRRAAVRLGVALTFLFFVKYNYWLLLVAALGVTTLAVHRRDIWDGARDTFAVIPWRTWLRSQLVPPLNYLILGLVAAGVYTECIGGWSLTLGGRTISMKTTRVVFNIAYGLFLLRLLGWWRTGGAEAAEATFGPSARPLAYWHLLPIAGWLLLPLRLRYFVWYISPANAERQYHATLADSAEFYWNGFVGEYTPGLPVALGVAALVGVAAVGWAAGRLRPAAGLGLLYLGLSAYLAMKHPNHKLRYEHSWAPIAFVLAGSGIAVLADALRHLLGRAGGLAVATVGLAGVVVVAGPAAFQPGFAEERGLNGVVGSTRDLSDAYLPEIADAKGVLVLGDTVTSPWAKWSYYERFGRTDGVSVDFRSLGWFARITPDVFAQWLNTTTATAVVFVEVPRTSPLWEPPTPDGTDAPLGPLMSQQTLFRHAKTIDVPDRGRVTVWKR